MWEIRARVNGLLVPSWPSSAVCPGPVANAISVPSPDFISARPVCTDTLRVEAFDLIFAAKGLPRQASRNTSLTLASLMVWSSVRSILIAAPSLTPHFGFDVGIDRQQVICAADCHAVAGI